MTDKEIIKEYEYQVKYGAGDPKVLDLINRYEAEIEDLQLEIEGLQATKEALINGQLTLQKEIERLSNSAKQWEETAKDLLISKEKQQAEIERLTTLSELGKMRANDYRVMRDRALKAEAEIERLQRLGASATRRMLKARTEAIEEVFDKIKAVNRWSCVDIRYFDKVYKEMVGEQKCD